jgi:hypothetical protein
MSDENEKAFVLFHEFVARLAELPGWEDVSVVAVIDMDGQGKHPVLHAHKADHWQLATAITSVAEAIAGDVEEAESNAT